MLLFSFPLQALSASEHSFPSMHTLAAKVSPAASFMAETFISPDEVTQTADTESDYPPGLDEFTGRLSADDSRVLVDLLKLAVADRVGSGGRDTLASILTSLGKGNPNVSPVCGWVGWWVGACEWKGMSVIVRVVSGSWYLWV